MENDFDFQDFFNLDLEVDSNLELPDTFSIGTPLQSLHLGVETAVGDIFTTAFQTPVLLESVESRFTEVEEDEITSVPSFQISSAADLSFEFRSQPTDLQSNLNTTLLPMENASSSSDTNAPPGKADLSSGVVVEKKKRTRVDRHKRETGNNSFGRRGNLRCAQCRKRNSKCVYASEWLPCEFCRTRNVNTPCVKLPGPTAAFRLTPSRQIPTAIDAVIPAEDVLLLQHIYSRKDYGMHLFIKQMAIVYGSSIECLSLRHAILEYSALVLEDGHFQPALYHHRGQACRALRLKMISPSGFSEGDVFAALILAYSTCLTDADSEEAAMHINGCLSMVQAMSQRSKYTPTSDVFTIFEPFVRDNICNLSILARYSSPRPSSLPFKRRVSYIRELFRACENPAPDEWMGYYTLKSVMGSVANTSCYLLFHISLSEGSEQSLKRYTLEHIRRELTDPDLLHTCNRLQLSGELERWWPITFFIGTVELTEALLSMPELLPGLSSPLVAGMACKLISYIRDLTGKDPAYRASFVDYLPRCLWCHLVLASLALPVEDIPNCELPLSR